MIRSKVDMYLNLIPLLDETVKNRTNNTTEKVKEWLVKGVLKDDAINSIEVKCIGINTNAGSLQNFTQYEAPCITIIGKRKPLIIHNSTFITA